jgi:cardiolipin synthase A/B
MLKPRTQTKHKPRYIPLIAFLVLAGCGSQEDVLLDYAGAQEQNALLGESCETSCETETRCEDVQSCEDVEQCGWQFYWKNYWWGSVPAYWYQCNTVTQCSTVQVCSEHEVCTESCEKAAFPELEDQALLRALNYWTTDELAWNLGLSSDVAQAITQNRIDNGGVFFGLEEVRVGGFDPVVHRSNGHVVNDQDRLMLLAPSISYNNSTTLFVDGNEQLNALIALIDSAEKYVHLNTMLFFDDPTGQLLAQALQRAAQRGVELRILFDYETTTLASNNRDSGVAVAGTPITPGIGVRETILAGCQPGVMCDVRSTSQETEYWDHYTVPGYNHWYDFTSCWWGQCSTLSTGERSKLAGQGVPEYMLKMQDYIQDSVETHHNVVNHQKYMIVDGSKLALGSSNFGANYQYEEDLDSNVKWRWHDGFSIITGPMAVEAHRIFAQQWFVNARGDIFDFESSFYRPSDRELTAEAGTAPMALLMSFPGDPAHLNMRYISEMLQNSNSDIYIENPYVTDGDLWGALDELDVDQASRVHFVTPMSMTDSPVNGAAVRCGGYTAASRGAKFYDYLDAELFSHLKLAVDTGKSMVHYGSYNLNMRSKRHDLELNFLTRDPDLMKRALDIIMNDVESSTVKELDFFYEDNTLKPECYFEEVTNWFT